MANLSTATKRANTRFFTNCYPIQPHWRRGSTELEQQATLGETVGIRAAMAIRISNQIVKDLFKDR
jgi:hypothetical protein